MTKTRYSTLIKGAGILSLSLMATTSQAQVWPQSEGAYSSTQNSPQWIEQRAPQAQYAPRQNIAPNTTPHATQPYYGQPNRGYPPQYRGYPQNPNGNYYNYNPNYNPGYYPPQNVWNGPTNMPFFGNNMNPWNNNGTNFTMPNMNMPSMPNMDMPSPSFNFPTMNMPFWN